MKTKLSLLICLLAMGASGAAVGPKYVGRFHGNATGLSNLNASALSSGTVPMGIVASGTNSLAGPCMVTDGTARYWSYNGGGLTNVASTNLVGAFVDGGANGANTQPAVRANGLVGGSVPAITILTNGNVGIGTVTDITSALTMGSGKNIAFIGAAAPIICSESIYPTVGNTYFTIFNDGGGASSVVWYGSSHATLANVIVVRNGGAETMRFSANNNVGIGTTSPVGKLDVNGALNATSVAATNAVTIWQFHAVNIPTNSIVASSASGTNWTYCVIGGLPRIIATNYAAAGKFLKCVGETVSEFP